MADVDIARTFRNISEQLQNVSNVLSSQAITQNIPSYDGNPKEFRSWINSIEKYQILNNLEEDKLCTVAYQSSKDVVSSFIKRLVKHPDVSWQYLKKELTYRFSEVQDCKISMKLLSSEKQKQNESVQIFAERLYSLAEELCQIKPQGGIVSELQLIEYFIDGLNQDSLKLKVMEKEPTTFISAVDIAIKHQNLETRINMRKSDSIQEQESKEINQLRPTKKCQYCKKLGHEINECKRRINEINMYTKVRTSKMRSSQNHKNGRRRDNIDCWTCGKLGHFSRECFYQGPKANQDQNAHNLQYSSDRQNHCKMQEN